MTQGVPAGKPVDAATDQWAVAVPNPIELRVGYELAQMMGRRSEESFDAALREYEASGELPAELKAAAAKEGIDETHFHSQMSGLLHHVLPRATC